MTFKYKVEIAEVHMQGYEIESKIPLNKEQAIDVALNTEDALIECDFEYSHTDIDASYVYDNNMKEI